jgi:2-octaprenylphenol hydroxylase
MKQKFHVVIVGAGVAGLTVAALLAQSSVGERLKITLVDAQQRPALAKGQEVALRVSAIATGSSQLLQSIGAWSCVDAERIAPYDCMRVWDESSTADSGDALCFDAAEFAVPQLGFIIENVMLQTAILDVLQRESIELLFESPITALHAQASGQEVQLEDGRSLHADLVIGADGARSLVRECAGIETQEWAYGQAAFVTHLQPERAHCNTAWQRFLSTGPLGMLPLSDGRISVVWSTTDEQAKWAMAATDKALGKALGEASDHVLGNLTVAGPRGAFPLQAKHARDYVKAGVALIGDAAHAVHPLAGQGANLGMQDAACLADVIAKAMQNGEHPGDRPFLRRFERSRMG